MGNSASEATSKTVLILGDFFLQSVEDKIAALGYTFQKRALPAAPLDWIEMQKDLKQLITSENLLAVLMFLSKEIWFYTSSSEYIEIWQCLLKEMMRATSLIFVHEENFQEEFFDDSDEIRISEISETQHLIRDLLVYLKNTGLVFNYLVEQLQLI